MMQNMFQEGLYQVFFKEARQPQPTTQDSDTGELNNARIHRWFGTVVNTRLLVTGYVAAGCLAMAVQRKASKLKIVALMALNVFSLLFGFSALLANSLVPVPPAALGSYQQRAGSYVANATSTVFAALCSLGSVYILFLSWRGLRRYSSPHIQAYCHVSQDAEDTNGLLEQEVNNL
ncbi:uncharacterized protein si:dkey-30c15.13 isoform X2 [Kryptolebias marmoratus]|uniref:uncharacterized protein si:dkey-30c15.13 isoform X2 n=1 Tax=Kryptolebias marmoratus TaxID=37003 RepID=UPI000D530102|nr:uncharacterized protein si:dkey-30c15.13 isoform X2 [Kryptolebias marmoratus]